METLQDKQWRFVKLICRLVARADELGYELTYGDAYRDPRVHGALNEKMGYGHRKSCHKLRLAVDFNLFKGDAYLSTTEQYEALGTYWESLGGTWGGRFGDGNHFSLEHEGVK